MLNGRCPGAGSRGRHEFREYDRKANIPFVPANVILPRVIFAAGEEEEPRMWEATMPAMLIIALAIGKLSVSFYQQNIMKQEVAYPDPLPDYGSGRYV